MMPIVIVGDLAPERYERLLITLPRVRRLHRQPYELRKEIAELIPVWCNTTN
jgi:hypothetical protein